MGMEKAGKSEGSPAPGKGEMGMEKAGKSEGTSALGGDPA
jgi:hypothetical protein